MLDRDSCMFPHAERCRLTALLEDLAELPVDSQFVCTAHLVPSAEVLDPLAADESPWIPVVTSRALDGDEETRVHWDRLTRLDEAAVHQLAHEICSASFERGSRPRRVHVSTMRLAHSLGSVIEPAQVPVTDAPPPVTLDAAGLLLETLEREQSARLAELCAQADLVRRTHAAALRLFEAAPWHLLGSMDVIEVETPPPGASCSLAIFSSDQDRPCAVMSSSRDALKVVNLTGRVGDASGSLWLLKWPVLAEISVRARFEALRLGLAPTACGRLPVVRYFGPRCSPSATTLMSAGQVAVLEALSLFGEAELDVGRWTTLVKGSDGPIEMTIAWPDRLRPPTVAEWEARGVMRDIDAARVVQLLQLIVKRRGGELLDPAAAEPGTPDELVDQVLARAQTPMEESMALCVKAMCQHGRLRLLAAREALGRCPDCPEAWAIIGQASSRPEEAERGLREAIAAGERLVAAEQSSGIGWASPELDGARLASLVLEEMLRNDGRTQEASEVLRTLHGRAPDVSVVKHFAAKDRLLNGDAEGALAILAETPEGRLRESQSVSWLRAIAGYAARGGTPQVRAWIEQACRADAAVARALLDPEYQNVLASRGASLDLMMSTALVTLRDILPLVDERPSFLDELRGVAERARDQLVAATAKRRFKDRRLRSR